MGADSPHIIVTEVPPGFLMRRNVRSHFSRFGTIARLTIRSTYCVITFENTEQARDAIRNGTSWKGMPMKIDFTSNHDPFGTDDALINEELNWFAEDPDFSFKPKKEKEKSRKYKSDSRSFDFPPQKLTRVDLTEDVDMVESPEENRPISKYYDEGRNRSKTADKKSSATARFLAELKGKPKVTEVKAKASFSEETKIHRSTDEGRSIMRTSEDSKTKHIFEESKSSKHSDDKPLFKFSEESKQHSYSTEDRESSPQLFDEPRMAWKSSEDSRPLKTIQERSTTPKLQDDIKLAPKLEETKVIVKSNDPPFFNKIANTIKDKLTILEERDKHIRLKLEKVVKMESSAQGTCPDMCPEKERIMRELRGIVAPYESLPDGRMDHGKAVKEYARSSADQEEPLPHDLRPQPVLTMTMSYLINCIISRIDEVPDENQGNWYDFSWGRLRAIRKDIIQQQLCDKNTVMILEQCARFHIACYDRLWGTSKSQFDDKINTETLVNCLQSLIHMYEDLRHKGVVCANEAEFNSYLILLKINSGFLDSEYQRYSKSLKESQVVKEAVKIHLSYNNNMFSTYFKLAKQTSYLNACLMQRFFQHVRIQALNTIVKAHCVPTKSSNISVHFIMDMLKIDVFDDCVSFCESMGLTLNENETSFKISRSDFYISENIYNIESPSNLVLKKRIPIAEAVVGSETTLPIYLNHSVHSSFNYDGMLNENAIDASDQEEKMLRDDVERKLLASQLKATLSHKIPSDKYKDSVDSYQDQSLAVDDPMEEGNEVDEPYSENEETTLYESAMESIFEAEVSGDEAETFEDTQNKSIVSETIPPDSSFFTKSEFNKPELPISSGESSPKLSFYNTNSFKKPPSEPPSPKSAFVPLKDSLFDSGPIFPDNSMTSPKFEFSLPTSKASLSFSSAFKSPSPPKTSDKPLTPKFLEKPVSTKTPDKTYSKTTNKTYSKSPEKIYPKTSDKTPPKTPEIGGSKINKKVLSEKNLSPIKPFVKSSPKAILKQESNDKLRKKLSENMKKISARKYFRLWKEKASRLKTVSKFEAMILHNMPAEDYVKLWGRPLVKRSFATASRLSQRKNTNLMVQMILHTDIIDKIDKNVRKIGKHVIDTLGEISVKKAEAWGNIAQPNPVFWKLVFALPTPPEGGTTFASKLKSWCKAAFYSRNDINLSEAELHISDAGVPVFSSVTVIEGLDDSDSCSNMTALVVVRARDWESTVETGERVQKLLKYCSIPIPLVILNLGQHIDHVEMKNMSGITYFNQCLWNTSREMTEILCDLARNIKLYNLKVKPFCNLLEICSEKLFDSLFQDSFLHDGLDFALNDPNNIIFFYNQLVNLIELEIVKCKVNNYFGTACDFKKSLEKYNCYNIFPDNYKDVNFEKSLCLRCNQCKLSRLKTKFNNSKELIAFFKNYCDDIGCEHLFKQLLRYIKPPDEDSGIKISDHLNSIQWLPLIEMIVKEILTSHLLTFKVVYRDDVIKNIFDSHYWFNSAILQKLA